MLILLDIVHSYDVADEMVALLCFDGSTDRNSHSPILWSETKVDGEGNGDERIEDRDEEKDEDDICNED
ncbi:hypothetical protein ABFS83_10G115800 [Erythranthe nasuta]